MLKLVSKFSITPGSEIDLEDIAMIHVAGWQGAYGGIIDQGYLDALSVEKKVQLWRQIIEEGDTQLLIARNEQEIAAGFCSFGKLKSPPPGMSAIRPLYTSELYAIYILPAYWRQGLGRELMASSIAKLQKSKHNSVCLWVLEKNSRAVAFYKALGGQRCGKIDVEIGPTKAREICFGWRDFSNLLS